ncbi:MAG TPA: hypothetical protein PK910_00695 [Bacteroidales bacterium]|nr:hypothetical protein [Bacteroidales bacterium]HRC88527.1 hypothetical protein [Bacteroidales bacterium]
MCGICGIISLASEIPPILYILNHNIQPDNQAVFDYLVFNRTDQTEATFFKDIKKLQHGCLMEIDLKCFPPLGGIKGANNMGRIQLI